MSSTAAHESAPSRRDFLRRAGLGGAALVLGPGALVGCGGSSSTAGGSSSNGGTSAGGTVRVRFSGPAPVATFWPLYVASQLGDFRHEHVDFTFVASAGEGVQQLVGGSAEADSEYIDRLIIAAEKGADLVGISMMVNSPFSFIVGPGIERWSDLRGKKIGVTTVKSTDAIIAAKMLAVNGVAPDSYGEVPAGGAAQKVAAITAGGIAGALFTQPQDYGLLERNPDVRRLGFSSDFVRSQNIGVFVKRSWATANRDGVVRLLRAQLSALEWLAEPANKARAVQILQTVAKVSQQAAATTYDLYVKQRLFTNALDLDPGAANKLLALAQAAGEAKFADVTKYFDLSYLHAAQAT